jgi:hypothetical protein
VSNIKFSTDLRNNYNEISAELLNSKLELYHLLDEGRAAIKEGRKRPFADAMKDIKQEIS